MSPYSKIKIPDCVILSQVSDYHWQINGAILINHYPMSKKRTAYIQNTTGGISNVTPSQALKWAANPESIPRNLLPKATSRKRNYKSAKRKLIAQGIDKCFWCKKALNDDVTIEHIVPLSIGGLDCKSNWSLAHKKCNQDQGNKLSVSR
jgi:5-methylcytosine-specific restriction endonuclease McrA